jgi:hypothetical protein
MNAAAAFDVAGHRTTRRFDLARRDAATLGGLEAEVAEGHVGATRGDARVATLLLLAVLSTCGLQHRYSPGLASGGRGSRTARRTR